MIRRDYVIARGRECGNLLPPGVPELRKSVEQDVNRTVRRAGFDRMKPNAIALIPGVVDTRSPGESLLNKKNSDLSHQVRKRSDFFIGAQINGTLDSPAFLLNETFEVMNRQKVNVRRVVPIVRE